MSKIKEIITPAGKILVVEVPARLIPKLYRDGFSNGIYLGGENDPAFMIQLRGNDFEMIGTIQGREFDFDPEEFVEKHLDDTYFNYHERRDHKYDRLLSTPERSFLSLLQSNGIYFDNPLGKEPEEDEEEDGNMIGYIDAIRHKRWSEAEEKRIKDKLVIIKVNE